VKLPCAHLSASALEHNLGVVRRFAPGSRVMAVIKANAYGHDIVPTARALKSADAFAVARLEEGLVLRAAGIRHRIILLEGIFSPGELQAAAQEQLDIVVHSDAQLSMLAAWQGAHRFNVWMKVDTGMNRLGFRMEDFSAALERVRTLTCVAELRVMTHLACADERNGSMTPQQLRRFDEVTAGLNLERSIANSAGLIAWPSARVQWVRPGLMLYGISPFANDSAATFGLRPVMRLATELIAIRQVKAGESVGYGATWRAARDLVLGIIAAGYGDGYPRAVPSNTPVYLEGREVPILGRVSMDMIAIDLTDVPHARLGSPVVLWGEELPVERIAAYSNTIPYELVCGLSQRVAVSWAPGVEG
jgi:alanine racemase